MTTPELILIIVCAVLVIAAVAAALVDHYRDKSRQLDNTINRILDDGQEKP